MIGFIVKGLLRDRSRSLFPFLTVVSGVALVVLLDSYVRGSTDAMFTTTANLVSGHLRVATQAYNRAGAEAGIDLALLGAESLLRELRERLPTVTWTPRIRFGGLIDIPDSVGQPRAQAPITGLAVDLSAGSPEFGILRFPRSLASGRPPAAPNEVLLSDTLAKRLRLHPGDQLTLVSSALNGNLTVCHLTLAGTVRFGINALDRTTMLADIRGIQQTLDMNDAVSEILGFLPGKRYDDRMAAQLADEYNATRHTKGEHEPEMATLRTASGLGPMFDLIGTASTLIVVVFVAAMAIVLWNAGLMGGIRRYGEFGIRLAIGESKNALYCSLLAEALIIGLAGSAVGTAIGLAFSYYLQEVGINIAGMTPNATIVVDDVLRARIGPTSFVIGFVPGLFATLIGTAISGLAVYSRQTAQLAKEFSG